MMQAAMPEIYEELRPLMFSIAYRMLGRVAEAEDVVQDAFVRYQQALGHGQAAIGSPKAYLSTVTTRLAIDHLRSARVRREQYVGEWLPEPLITDDGMRRVDDSDSLSMAFLLLLERLTPTERAVFLLHDVFDYGYDEVAEIVGRSETNCRQLAVRARRHVEGNRPRFEASKQTRDELAARFFDAVSQGDMDGLVSLLAADVVVYGDGGGVTPSGRSDLRTLPPACGRGCVPSSASRSPTRARTPLDQSRSSNVFSLSIAGGTASSARGGRPGVPFRHEIAASVIS